MDSQDRPALTLNDLLVQKMCFPAPANTNDAALSRDCVSDKRVSAKQSTYNNTVHRQQQ